MEWLRYPSQEIKKVSGPVTQARLAPNAFNRQRRLLASRLTAQANHSWEHEK